MEQNIQGNAETGASDASYNDGASDLLWLELLSGDVLEDGNDQLYTGETEKSARFDLDECGVLLDGSGLDELCAKRIKLDSEEHIISTSSTVQELEDTCEENIAGSILCLNT